MGNVAAVLDVHVLRGGHDRSAILELDRAADAHLLRSRVAVEVRHRYDGKDRTIRNRHRVIRICGIRMIDRQIFDHADDAGHRVDRDGKGCLAVIRTAADAADDQGALLEQKDALARSRVEAGVDTGCRDVQAEHRRSRAIGAIGRTGRAHDSARILRILRQVRVGARVGNPSEQSDHAGIGGVVRINLDIDRFVDADCLARLDNGRTRTVVGELEVGADIDGCAVGRRVAVIVGDRRGRCQRNLAVDQADDVIGERRTRCARIAADRMIDLAVLGQGNDTRSIDRHIEHGVADSDARLGGRSRSDHHAADQVEVDRSSALGQPGRTGDHAKRIAQRRCRRAVRTRREGKVEHAAEIGGRDRRILRRRRAVGFRILRQQDRLSHLAVDADVDGRAVILEADDAAQIDAGRVGVAVRVRRGDDGRKRARGDRTRILVVVCGIRMFDRQELGHGDRARPWVDADGEGGVADSDAGQGGRSRTGDDAADVVEEDRRIGRRQEQARGDSVGAQHQRITESLRSIRADVRLAHREQARRSDRDGAEVAADRIDLAGNSDAVGFVELEQRSGQNRRDIRTIILEADGAAEIDRSLVGVAIEIRRGDLDVEDTGGKAARILVMVGRVRMLDCLELGQRYGAGVGVDASREGGVARIHSRQRGRGRTADHAADVVEEDRLVRRGLQQARRHALRA